MKQFLMVIVSGILLLGTGCKSHKEKKEQEKKIVRPAPRQPLQPKVEPPAPIRMTNIKPVKLSEVVKKEVFHRKKKPRIGKLVSGLKSKKELILLSEILVNKHNIN